MLWHLFKKKIFKPLMLIYSCYLPNPLFKKSHKFFKFPDTSSAGKAIYGIPLYGLSKSDTIYGTTFSMSDFFLRIFLNVFPYFSECFPTFWSQIFHFWPIFPFFSPTTFKIKLQLAYHGYFKIRGHINFLRIVVIWKKMAYFAAVGHQIMTIALLI
jgi:hypothetical protein